MAKETKTVTIRIDMDGYNYVTNNGEDMFNTSLVEFVRRAQAEERIRLLDIKDIFSKEEWMGLANSLNGTIVDDYMRYSNELFVAHCEDAERYENSFSNMGANLNSVCEKIKKMTRIQVATTLERVARFWDNQNGTGEELEKWAQW